MSQVLVKAFRVSHAVTGAALGSPVAHRMHILVHAIGNDFPINGPVDTEVIRLKSAAN